MLTVRNILDDTIPHPNALRDVLEKEFLVSDANISLRKQLERAVPYDSAIVLVHGVLTSQNPSYSNFEANIRSKWPDALKNTLVVNLYWGSVGFHEWASVIGTRTDQIYGMYAEVWSGTAKLADAIGRIQSLIGADKPITVAAHSLGCSVVIAALQEGLTVQNLILMGSPLDIMAVQNQTHNTRFVDASVNVSGAIINCSSTEDGWSQLGAWASALGGSGAMGASIGMVGLPANVLTHPKFSGLYLDDVDHNGPSGWFSANWFDHQTHEWTGVTPDVFIEVLASLNHAKPTKQVLPRNQREIEEQKAYVNSNTRDGWYGSSDYNSFFDIVYTPANSTVRWSYDDKDDAKYKIQVDSGTIVAALHEAVGYSWDRQTGPATITPNDGSVEAVLATQGIPDATYMLQIDNPLAVPGVASIHFQAWDR